MEEICLFISVSILNIRVPGDRCVLNEDQKEEIKELCFCNLIGETYLKRVGTKEKTISF